jgi:hypothetical protein
MVTSREGTQVKVIGRATAVWLVVGAEMVALDKAAAKATRDALNAALRGMK